MFKETMIVKEILKSRESWKKVYKECYRYFEENIGEEGCFSKVVKFKFNKKEMFTHKLPIAKFLTHIILWEPFIDIKVKLDSSYIIKSSNIKNDELRDYYNEKIIGPYTGVISSPELNLIIAVIQENLKKISEEFSLIFTIGTSVKDIIDLMEKYPEFREMIYYTPPEKAQPKEIEDDYERMGDKMIKFLKTVESPFKSILLANDGVKPKQLRQYLLCVGFQSNMDGVTYPKPIQSSFANKGLQTASEYLLDATGGRKAQIFNKEYTGRSGYFSRRLNQAALDNLLDVPGSDCNTKHYIKYFVETERHLKIINGMYYKTTKKSFLLKLINWKKDTKLIGEYIYLRSPLTCAGEKVCSKCYGSLYDTNSDINAAIYGAEEISSRITQGILSSKHLLVTDSSEIELCGNYTDYMFIEGNAIIFDANEEFVNKRNKKKQYYFVIREDEMTVAEDEEDGKEFNKSFSKIYIKDNHGNLIDTIYDKNEAEFYIPKDMEQLSESRILEEVDEFDAEIETVEYWIPFNKIEEGTPIFYLVIQNKELTKPLKEIISLLDTKDHLGCHTINELIEKAAQLFLTSKLDFGRALLHLTIAIRRIIRKKDNIYQTLDFSQPVLEEYVILTIKTSIYYNPSVLTSLSFEKVGQQLKKPETFDKTETSILDPFYFEKF